jgi:hypothetical protein
MKLHIRSLGKYRCLLGSCARTLSEGFFIEKIRTSSCDSFPAFPFRHEMPSAFIQENRNKTLRVHSHSPPKNVQTLDRSDEICFPSDRRVKRASWLRSWLCSWLRNWLRNWLRSWPHNCARRVVKPIMRDFLFSHSGQRGPTLQGSTVGRCRVRSWPQGSENARFRSLQTVTFSVVFLQQGWDQSNSKRDAKKRNPYEVVIEQRCRLRMRGIRLIRVASKLIYTESSHTFKTLSNCDQVMNKRDVTREIELEQARTNSENMSPRHCVKNRNCTLTYSATSDFRGSRKIKRYYKFLRTRIENRKEKM